MFVEAYLSGEYLGWFRVTVAENCNSLQIGDADGDESPGEWNPSSGAVVEVVEIISPSCRPL